MTTCPLHPEQDRPCPTCGIARVRAALAAAEPSTPTHDLAKARAKADREARR